MEYIDNCNWLMSRFGKGVLLTALMCVLSTAGIAFGAESETLDEYALEDFVVTTGSYIPELVGANFASPVAQITSEYIEDTGLSSNLLDILRKSVPQFYGKNNLGRSNADLGANRTGGGSKLGLRNTQTLVLVNGRRVAFSPIVAAYGDYFVDLNMIPVSAVDKIEILKDGASATYGTDATSGVVNIILKNEYEGFEVGGRYGVSSNEGNWEERRFNFTGGIIEENFRVIVSGEWYKADPLWHHERDFAQPKYGGSDFGGKLYGPDGALYVLNPELDAPSFGTKISIADAVAQGLYVPVNDENDLTFGRGVDQPLSIDLSDHVTLLTGDERKSLITSFEFDLNDNVTFFSDLIVTKSDSFSQVAAQGIPFFSFAGGFYPITSDHPYNPFSDAGPVFAYNRFLEYPRQRYYDTKTIRLVSGLKGKLENGFGYEVAALYNKAETAYKRTGLYDAAGHTRMLELAGIIPGAGPGDTPVINPFSRVHTPGVLDDVFGTAWGSFESDLRQLDARIFGDLITLPAGELQFALGTEYREERLDVDADANTIADAWFSGDFIVPFSKDRNVYSVYLELKVPLIGDEMGVSAIHSLELELSGRHEQYSDTSDPLVPKVALIWEPFDDSLFFRATYSESFNAPSLFMLNAPEIVGDSSREIHAYPFVGADLNNPPPIWGEPHVRSKGNENLDPGESDSLTIGFVWQPKPLKGLTIEIDYYRIRERNTPGFVAESAMVQDVELNGPASQFASLVRIGSFGGSSVSAPGELLTYNPDDVYITSPLLNVYEQRISGIDVTLNYAYEINESTNLLLRSTIARITQYDTQATFGSLAIETEGRATTLNGTIPDFKVYSVMNLKHKNMGFTLGHSYTPSMPYEFAPAGARIERYSTFDLSASYTFKSGVAEGLRVLVGVNNVTNEMPPLAPELFGDANADIATYDPTGRVFFIETSYKF